MIAITALAIGVIFGAGIFLMLRRDLVKMVAGTLLLTNAVIVLVVAAGFGQPATPIAPIESPSLVSDPLVQALALTAIVIGFGTTSLLFKIALAVQESHGTVDLERLLDAEEEDEPRIDQEGR